MLLLILEAFGVLLLALTRVETRVGLAKQVQDVRRFEWSTLTQLDDSATVASAASTP